MSNPAKLSKTNPQITSAMMNRMLAEAQKAYFELIMGKKVVSVRGQDGTTVSYTPANKDELQDLINTLIYAIDKGQSPFGRITTRAISFSL